MDLAIPDYPRGMRAGGAVQDARNQQLARGNFQSEPIVESAFFRSAAWLVRAPHQSRDLTSGSGEAIP
jgi:hypothetical protein